MKKGLRLFLAGLTVVSAAGCGNKKMELTTEQVTVELGDSVKVSAADITNLSEKKLEMASIDITGVDSMTVGEYKGYVVYREERYPFTVVVEDTTAPTAEVLESVVTLVGTPYYVESMMTEITELTGQVTVGFRISPVSDNIYSEEIEANRGENRSPEEGAENLQRETEANDVVPKEFQVGDVRCNRTALLYMEAGEYDNVLTITDASGNQTEYPFHVVVRAGMVP